MFTTIGDGFVIDGITSTNLYSTFRFTDILIENTINPRSLQVVVNLVKTQKKCFRMPDYEDFIITTAFYFPKSVDFIKIHFKRLSVGINLSDYQPTLEQILREARQIPKYYIIKEDHYTTSFLTGVVKILMPPYDTVPIVINYQQEVVQIGDLQYYRAVLIHPFIPDSRVRGSIDIEFETDTTFLIEKMYNIHPMSSIFDDSRKVFWIPRSIAKVCIYSSLYEFIRGNIEPIYNLSVMTPSSDPPKSSHE